MERYRIRVVRAQFADPHYVTKLGDEPRYTSIEVNKNPCSWRSKSKAEQHLKAILEHFKTAEIERFTQDGELPID